MIPTSLKSPLGRWHIVGEDPVKIMFHVNGEIGRTHDSISLSLTEWRIMIREFGEAVRMMEVEAEWPE